MTDAEKPVLQMAYVCLSYHMWHQIHDHNKPFHKERIYRYFWEYVKKPPYSAGEKTAKNVFEAAVQTYEAERLKQNGVPQPPSLS